ncbi:MAG: hypothetical protein K9K93_07695, partial [Acholeplasmataceae bacterium]|nr:hypothetical protein [Acholeplasmataceae bacterium]
MNRIKRYLSIKREQNARALLLLGIIMFNVLLWFGSSVLAYVIAPGTYGNVAGALWESGITWMLEPGFYDPATDVSIRIISIVVIITSMITFSGGIIAYMASLFASVIDAARQGRNKAYLYDHILILNWNHKALELINDYGHDDETTTVVIMSDREKEEIERNLKRKLTENRHRGQKRLNIIVRQGDVFSKSDLEDVSASRARAVIVLSDEEAARGQMTYHKDILAMKTVMLVCSLETTIEQTVIVEIKDPDSAALIKNKIGKETPGNIHILTIMPDELMGRLIAQTLLMPALNNVYQELFSFDGAEFYAIEERDVKDYLLTHDKAIPIYTLEGKTYVLAENRDDIHSLRRNGPVDPKSLKIRSYT